MLTALVAGTAAHKYTAKNARGVTRMCTVRERMCATWCTAAFWEKGAVQDVEVCHVCAVHSLFCTCRILVVRQAVLYRNLHSPSTARGTAWLMPIPS